MRKTFKHDILVIGSGAAGLTAALTLAKKAKVAVISKGPLGSGSTRWAQGGIAGVLDSEDSIDSHVNDTLKAGNGLCREEAVQFTVERSKESIEWLIRKGVSFTSKTPSQNPDEKSYHLTKEGGHSFRRIIHAADATGLEVQSALLEQVKSNPNIELFEDRIAIDLIIKDRFNQGEGCSGAYVFNRKTDHVESFLSHFVILATGGASKSYLYSTNPDGATGDGIAIAWRAGCRVANMEFNQFHPTCLYHVNERSFLITEAVRGEGGILRLPDGERFMHNFDSRQELAPRDVVARAIDHEMKRLGCEHLYLDITHKPSGFVQSHFPTIYERCKSLGIDITTDPIPVVPAAHYTCGGVVTDLDGHTDIPGLYAIGETSSTGLHGANRLASNSLLECLVFARSAAKDILKKLPNHTQHPQIPFWDESQVTDSDEDVVISHNWEELRRFMWDYVGIVRTNKRLIRAQNRIKLLKKEIHDFYSNYKVSNDLLELRNLVTVAELIVESALLRKESRGLHYSLDYPDTNKDAYDTIMAPQGFKAENKVHTCHIDDIPNLP